VPRAVAALALALAALAPPAQAMGSLGTSRADASIDLAIVIPPTVIARTVAQAGAVSITARDIERGYVDLDGATSLRLSANDPSGYRLAVWYDWRLLSRVLLRIGERVVSADAPGRRVHVASPRMLDAPLLIDYRLYLARGTRPGTYPWPLALRFEPGP
jgi:hypothetical protein